MAQVMKVQIVKEGIGSQLPPQRHSARVGFSNAGKSTHTSSKRSSSTWMAATSITLQRHDDG